LSVVRPKSGYVLDRSEIAKLPESADGRTPYGWRGGLKATNESRMSGHSSYWSELADPDHGPDKRNQRRIWPVKDLQKNREDANALSHNVDHCVDPRLVVR
jgi:hypothetical protein